MKKRSSFLLRTAIAAMLLAAGQSLREQVLNPITHSAGSSMCYEYAPQKYTAPPAGYKPFYINHLGRHGSRNHTSESLFPSLSSLLGQAAEQGLLTSQGEELRSRIDRVKKSMDKRYGDLTQKGAREHVGIASRMAATYPEVFAGAEGIDARSTLSPRCILSMASFCGQLRALYPRIDIRMESSDANNYYMNYYSPEYRDYYDNGPWKEIYKGFQSKMIKPEGLLARLFTTVPSKVGDGRDFMNNLWYAAAILQDMDSEESIYDMFTPDEIYAMWQVHNLNQYLRKGPSEVGGRLALSIAKPMLRNFLATSDAAVAGKGPSANLRFAHGENIMPFTALTSISGASAVEADPYKVAEVWQDWRITPMAANVQWIFYRNGTGDVLVKILHNEREVTIPLEPFQGPYYRWEDVREYYSAIAEK